MARRLRRRLKQLRAKMATYANENVRSELLTGAQVAKRDLTYVRACRGCSCLKTRLWIARCGPLFS